MMTRDVRSRALGVLMGAFLLSFSIPPGSWAQTRPFSRPWDTLAGERVFAVEGCGKCHAIHRVGGKVGPDLGQAQTGQTFYGFGAALWNHGPRMAEKMAETGITRPSLPVQQMEDLIGYLFSLRYFDPPGDTAAGQQVFSSKGCVQCHAVGGQGGTIGPPLDFLKRSSSPIHIAAAMWNHGPEMAEVMRARGIPRPTFQEKELANLIAYIISAAKGEEVGGGYRLPGTAESGKKLFVDKSCALCHSVGGKGGKVGPQLRPHIGLVQFAANMWNHGPQMWAIMKAKGIEVPRLKAEEMADIVAYLYTAHYLEETGRPKRGQRLFAEKGCLNCHSIRGKGGKVGIDLATSQVVSTSVGVVSAMWTHIPLMASKAKERGIPWPHLTGQELADLSAYLHSITAPRK